MVERSSLTRFAWISIAAAVSTIALKGGAYFLTGSVGLLSDALESVVNLVAAFMALAMLTLAARPPDEEHTYGHDKAEYLATGFEGALILIAALSIGVTAGQRLIDPRPIDQAGLGLMMLVVASIINLGVARVLLRAGRRYRSIALEADAHHLMTDVLTSAGVLVGVGAVAVTGWNRLDPLIGLAVAAHIIRSGVQLMHRAALGLLDTALPEEERATIREILERYGSQGVQYHALRTRQAGVRRFVSMHVLVPGGWTVQRGHHLLEEIERRIRAAVPASTVFTHLEPLEDPVSWEDTRLERSATAPPDPDEEADRLPEG